MPGGRTARRSGRVAAGLRMGPAVARVGVRRLRQRARSRPSAERWPVEGVSCRTDLGTSTAACESAVPVDARLLQQVVASVGGVRRIAWFVADGDVALERTLAEAGFVCEGWAAPPVGSDRPYRLWALLTGAP